MSPHDPPGPGRSSHRRRLRVASLGGWFLLGLLACLARDPVDHPLILDNQHYFFIAERAASGVPPHVSHFDPKHSLSLLATAAAIRAGRLVGLDDVLAARALSILVTAGTVAAVWAFAVAISGRLLCGHLAALVMLSFDEFLVMGVMGARPKVFLAFALALTGLAVAARRPFLAGLGSALSFLCWQPALMALGGAAVLLLPEGRRLRSATRLLVGALLPVLLYHLYFLAVGAHAEMVEQAYVYPSRYMTHEVETLAAHVRFFFELERPSGQTVLRLGFALLAVGFWAALLARGRRALPELAARPGLAFAFLLGTGSLLFTLYDQQGKADHFFVFPFMAACTGWALGQGVAWLGRGRPRLGGALAAVCLLVLLANTAILPSRPLGPVTLERQRELARLVRGFLEDGDRVWAVGCTHLLALNHVDNHVRYGFFFRGTGRYMRKLVNSPEGYRPIREGAMPDVVLIGRQFPRSMRWIRTEYRQIPSPEFAAQGIRVMRRRPPP